MNFKLLFLLTTLGNQALLANSSLIIEENNYACKATATFHGQVIKFEEIHWHPKSMTLSCYYLFEMQDKKIWKVLPPGGEINLKEKIKPNTCRVDENKKRLIGCISLD